MGLGGSAARETLINANAAKTQQQQNGAFKVRFDMTILLARSVSCEGTEL
jgi:hypothetical protein